MDIWMNFCFKFGSFVATIIDTLIWIYNGDKYLWWYVFRRLELECRLFPYPYTPVRLR